MSGDDLPGLKRKAETIGDDENVNKRQKPKKQWQSSHQRDRAQAQAGGIQAGDAGIWATCPKGREGKCVAELRDLFEEYAKILYESPEDTTSTENIEQDLQAEIDELKRPTQKQLFVPVKLDVQCVVFFRVVEPVEPISLVTRICEDAASGMRLVRTRFTQRLTPMSLLGHASPEGLDKIAARVLAPVFHKEPLTSVKRSSSSLPIADLEQYAIRPNARNHNSMNRDEIIKQVAKVVGPGHVVDLKNYDALILVETYKHLCGISIVTNAFDRLKRFNLTELAQNNHKAMTGPAQDDTH